MKVGFGPTFPRLTGVCLTVRRQHYVPPDYLYTLEGSTSPKKGHHVSAFGVRYSWRGLLESLPRSLRQQESNLQIRAYETRELPLLNTALFGVNVGTRTRTNRVTVCRATDYTTHTEFLVQDICCHKRIRTFVVGVSDRCTDQLCYVTMVCRCRGLHPDFPCRNAGACLY